MTQVGQDTLGTRSKLTAGGKDVSYYSLKKAAAHIGDISRLPFSMKVLLENLLRFEDGGFTVSTADIQAIADWQKNPSESSNHCHAGWRHQQDQPAGAGQPRDRPLGDGGRIRHAPSVRAEHRD